MAEEWIDGTDQSISLNVLKAKLCQVKAKNPDLWPNKMLFDSNDVHNGVSGLTYIDIMEFEKRFSHDPDHEQNVWNSYQTDHNQNHWTSEKYYFWTRDHTRLQKVIEAYGVKYLADDLHQTMTEIIQTLEDITTIKEFKNVKTPIILEKLKERLSLIKNKEKARYEAERLDQINFFLETDSDGTAWNKLAEGCGASWLADYSKN